MERLKRGHLPLAVGEAVFRGLIMEVRGINTESVPYRGWKGNGTKVPLCLPPVPVWLIRKIRDPNVQGQRAFVPERTQLDFAGCSASSPKGRVRALTDPG